MEHRDKPAVKRISPDKAQQHVCGKKFLVRAVPATDDDGYRIRYDQHVIIVNEQEEPVIDEEPVVLDTKAYHLELVHRQVYDRLRHTISEVKKDLDTIFEASRFRPSNFEAFTQRMLAYVGMTEPMKPGEGEEMESLIKSIEQEITRIEQDTLSQLYVVVLKRRRRKSTLEKINNQIRRDRMRMNEWIRLTREYVEKALWAIPGRKFPA